jgi:hypothetical protein
MKRQVSYQWRLREVMATRGIFAASDLSPCSPNAASSCPRCRSGAWSPRLPSPSLPVLAALCDILGVAPTDLIATRAENVAPRRTAASGGADIVGLANTIRPKRARITPDW